MDEENFPSLGSKVTSPAKQATWHRPPNLTSSPGSTASNAPSLQSTQAQAALAQRRSHKLSSVKQQNRSGQSQQGQDSAPIPWVETGDLLNQISFVGRSVPLSIGSNNTTCHIANQFALAPPPENAEGQQTATRWMW